MKVQFKAGDMIYRVNNATREIESCIISDVTPSVSGKKYLYHINDNSVCIYHTQINKIIPNHNQYTYCDTLEAAEFTARYLCAYSVADLIILARKSRKAYLNTFADARQKMISHYSTTGTTTNIIDTTAFINNAVNETGDDLITVEELTMSILKSFDKEKKDT